MKTNLGYAFSGNIRRKRIARAELKEGIVVFLVFASMVILGGLIDGRLGL